MESLFWKKRVNIIEKEYTVSRKKVQNAFECLCFGTPIGGLDQPLSNFKKYSGPDHAKKKLKVEQQQQKNSPQGKMEV